MELAAMPGMEEIGEWTRPVSMDSLVSYVLATSAVASL
jgi:hypothetical protein